MNKWRTTGVLQDLRKLDASFVDKFIDGINEGYLKAGQGEKGEIFGLPYVGGYWGLVLNEDVWEKAGKPALPKTYDDMVTFAKAMTMDKNGRKLGESGFDARNVDTYGMTWVPLGSTQENYIWNYFWAYGSDYVSQDGQDIGFGNDQGRAALQHMKALVTSGGVTPPNLFTDASRWGEAVYEGKTGMAWTQGFTQAYATKYPKARIKVLDLPAGPAGQFIVGACGFLSVAAKSKSKDASMDFVKYLVSDKPLQDFTTLILAKPIRAQSGNYFASLPDERMRAYMNGVTAYAKYAKPTRILAYQPQEYLTGKINDYLLGRQDLDAMIKDASTQIKQMAKAAK
jgi:ABC-type glycerol-3-phosphate transport system substrate-binding protein